MNLCDTCIHRKVCCCEDPTMPTEDCLYYDPIPKHWRWLPQILLGERVWDCSECKTIGSPLWKRCPVCEAKMDGDANDKG